MRALCGVAVAALLATSPAVGGEGPDFTIPAYTGAYQPQGVDERGLWMVDDESERLLRDSPVVIRDAALNDYVRSILCRTVGHDRCDSVRIYVMRAPWFNATMSPNGTMRVYSGLLLRVRDEAELASILGHEFAHFELRHTLADFRRRRAGSDLAAWTALLGVAIARYGGGYVNTDMRVSIYGALAHYDRDQERQADVLGFAYMANASFRPSAAADVWRGMMNETDATRLGRMQRSTRYDNVAFFASHPTDLERADYLSALANRVQGGEIAGRREYQAALAPWLDDFLDDQIKLNDFGGTEYLLTRLAVDGWTGPLYFARGELYRQRGNPRDLVSAAEFYRQALALAPDHAESQRGLGLTLIRSGNLDEGRTALSAYIAARPDATDAAILRTLLPTP